MARCRLSIEARRPVIAQLKLAGLSLPLHQLFQGFGCDAEEPLDRTEPETQDGGQSCAQTESALTIAQAAKRVLEDAGEPLNTEEIFARIVDQASHHFSAKNPISVLGIELNRYSRGTTCSTPRCHAPFCQVRGWSIPSHREMAQPN